MRLAQIEAATGASLPWACISDDKPFRLASIAFARPPDAEDAAALLDTVKAHGVCAAINNLWVLGWIGPYDKLAMSWPMLSERYGLPPTTARSRVVYYDDSEDDTPMFRFFPQSIGMNVVKGSGTPLIGTATLDHRRSRREWFCGSY